MGPRAADLHSILVNGKRGYARHSETLHRVVAVGALTCRHGVPAAEVRLSGVRADASDRAARAATVLLASTAHSELAIAFEPL